MNTCVVKLLKFFVCTNWKKKYYEPPEGLYVPPGHLTATEVVAHLWPFGHKLQDTEPEAEYSPTIAYKKYFFSFGLVLVIHAKIK